MKKPSSLVFEDYEVPVSDLYSTGNGVNGPVPTTWTRTQFNIPNNYSAPAEVTKWLDENCPGRYSSWFYQDPRSKEHAAVMVVKFESRNDALMFKLQGGHQSWENK